MDTSITEFFATRLKAPLVNQRWSWGSVDAAGRVFLREWLDQPSFSYKDRMVSVFSPNDAARSELGINERKRQIEMIRAGAPGYIVWVYRAPGSEIPWTITGFRDDAVFPILEIVDIGDSIFARFGSPVPVREVA